MEMRNTDLHRSSGQMREPTLTDWTPTPSMIAESNAESVSTTKTVNTVASKGQNSLASDANINDEDGFLDEESWNWPVLCARIFAFVLLFLVLVCLCLYDLNPKFLVLAAFIAIGLMLVILGTYINLWDHSKACLQKCGCCKADPSDLKQSLTGGGGSSNSSNADML